jgi:hypothetical protein
MGHWGLMSASSPPETGTTPVAAYVPDLMDRSRVEIAGRTTGLTFNFVAGPEDLVSAVRAGARLIVIDLAHAGVLDVLPHLRPAHTVGFASHVDKTLLDAAKAVGCDEVLPRSAVFRRLARLGAADQGPVTSSTRVTSTDTSSVCDDPPPSTDPRKGETSQ